MDLRSELADRLRAVEQATVDLGRRIERLERQADHVSAGVIPPSDADAGLATPIEDRPMPGPRFLTAASASAASLAGRTLMVLGGAFLLRAITEAGSLPQHGGLALGFTYGVAWFGAADRAGSGNRWSALSHGIAALAITVPLVFEAAIHFDAIGPWTAALALGAIALAGVTVARHRHLGVLAVFTVACALITLLALAIGTGSPVPFVALALVLSAAIAALPADEPWRALRWPAAAVTALLLASLLVGAGGSAPPASPGALASLAAVYAASGLWSGSAKRLIDRHPPTSFESAETVAAIVLGVGGCLWMAGLVAPGLQVALGLVVLLLAAASYALAFGEGPASPATSRLFFHQGFLLTALATLALLDAGPTRAAWLATIGVLFAWTGGRRLEPNLLAHGALFIAVAAIDAGAGALVGRAWIGTATVGIEHPAAIAIVIGAAAVALLGPRLAAASPGSRLTAASRLVLAAILVICLCSALVLLAAPAAGSPPGPRVMAVVRGAALATAAVVAALAGRTARGRALGWLVMPILAVAALRIVVGDLWHGSATLSFVSLATYGLALSLSARVRRAGT